MTKLPSPFSAQNLQETPLFDRSNAAKSKGALAFKFNAASSADGVCGGKSKVTTAARSSSLALLHKKASLDSLGSTSLTSIKAYPAHGKAPEDDMEEEVFGELSGYETDASKSSSGLLNVAVSIAPKASGSIPIITGDGPHLGFWADVGASTLDLEPVKEELGRVESDFSDCVGDSDEESEEEDVLLPWDL